MKKFSMVFAALFAATAGFSALAQNETYPELSSYYIEVSPESGTYAPEDLSKITVTFTGSFGSSATIEEWLPTQWPPIMVQEMPSNEPIVELYGDEVTIENESSFSIDLTGKVEAGKRYYFTIDAGCVVINRGGTLYTNPEIVEQYLCWGGMEQGFYIETPAVNTTSYLPVIEYTWDYQNVTPTEKGLSIVVSVAGVGPIEIPEDAVQLVYLPRPGDDPGTPEPIAETTNVLYIDLGNALAGYEGRVSITIPEGIVENEEGQLNQEDDSLSFNVYPLYNGHINCWDANEEGMFNFAWEGTPEPYSYAMVSYDRVPVLNEAGDEVGSLKQGYYSSFGGSYPDSSIFSSGYGSSAKWYINFAGLDLTDGEYTVWIPEGWFIISVQKEEEDDSDYTLIDYLSPFAIVSVTVANGNISTKVEKVGNSENEIYTVYNLQGVKVMEGKDLSGLDNGLYIVNGKKVIIRK